MMPTNDERREVARRIRRIPEEGKPVAFNILARQLGLEFDPGFMCFSACTPESVMRLADLIEPEPERTCHRVMRGLKNAPGFVDGFCSECWHMINEGAVYCEHCGAKVVRNAD